MKTTTTLANEMTGTEWDLPPAARREHAALLAAALRNLPDLQRYWAHAMRHARALQAGAEAIADEIARSESPIAGRSDPLDAWREVAEALDEVLGKLLMAAPTCDGMGAFADADEE